MKPGYYIDWTGDMMIVYPNNTVEIWSRAYNKFFVHTVDSFYALVEEVSDSKFLGEL